MKSRLLAPTGSPGPQGKGGAKDRKRGLVGEQVVLERSGEKGAVLGEPLNPAGLCPSDPNLDSPAPGTLDSKQKWKQSWNSDMSRGCRKHNQLFSHQRRGSPGLTPSPHMAVTSPLIAPFAGERGLGDSRCSLKCPPVPSPFPFLTEISGIVSKHP